MTRLLKSDNYPYGIGGLAFTLDEDTVSRSRAALTEDTPRHTIQRLVHELPTDKSLHFYDRYHPPREDLTRVEQKVRLSRNLLG